VIEQILQIMNPSQAYFWATHSGAEIDLVFSYKSNKYVVEVKFNEAPKITASMKSARKELRLDHLWIIYPGNESYPVSEKISVCSLSDIDRLPEKALRNQQIN
jgi:predicted AAA+ superfamily ATPase